MIGRTSVQLAFRAPWAAEALPPAPLRRARGGAGPRPARARQCSPQARARTINVTKLPLRLQQAAYTRSFWDAEVEAQRPKKRSECGTTRPCPWLSCRHHTAIAVDEENGSIKEIFPEYAILAEPDGDGLERLQADVGTCALDIAEQHDDGTGGVGGLVALYQIAQKGRPAGQTPGMTIEETGAANNISQERVRQISTAALQSLRVSLRRMERE